MSKEHSACANCVNRGVCIYRIPIFSKITKEDASAIFNLVRHKEYRKGATVFNEGQQARQLMLLRYGKMKLVRYGHDGEELLVDTLVQGDIYGGDEIFIERLYSETGEVTEDLGICLIPKEAIRKLCLERPHIGLKLSEYLNQKLLHNRDLMEIITTKDSLRKLLMYLIFYADSNDSTELEISQADIAASINLTKETVNRKLSELQQAGLLRVAGKKKLQIVSLPELKEYLITY